MSDLIPENVARLVPYSPGKPIEELERELGIKNAVKLASNENPTGPSPRALEAVRAHLASSHRYPDAATHDLRRALATHHGIAMDEIVLGNGSNELIDLICRTYASPADHAVIGAPSFVCYHLGLTAANVPFDTVRLRDLVYWNVDDVLGAVTDKTKLVFIDNPNNPTGTHVPKDELSRLLRELPPRVVAVLDEAYVHFAGADDYQSALELRDLRERLLVLRTFSKAYGLAALRVGYAIGRPEIVGYLNRVRAPFNVNGLAQVAAHAALSDYEYVARYVEMNQAERTRVGTELTRLGLKVTPSQTNFVFVELDRPAASAYDALLRMGVIVRPIPVTPNHVRITIGTPSENDRLLGAMQELIA